MKYPRLTNDPRYWAASTAFMSAMAGYEFARFNVLDAGTVFEGAYLVATLGFFGSRFLKSVKGVSSPAPESQAPALRE